MKVEPCGIDKPLRIEDFTDHAARQDKVVKGIARNPTENRKQNEQQNKRFECPEYPAQKHIDDSKGRKAVYKCATDTTQKPAPDLYNNKKKDKA